MFQQGPPERHPLLQVLPFTVVLSIRLHLDLALIGVEKFQLLLELHPQGLALSLLSLIQAKLQAQEAHHKSILDI